MLPAHLQHRDLHLGAHLVRAGPRSVELVRQRLQSTIRVPGQPGVQGLPRDPQRAAVPVTVSPAPITASTA
jgi:hypothetical protein